MTTLAAASDLRGTTAPAGEEKEEEGVLEGENNQRRVVHVNLRLDTLYIGPNTQSERSFSHLALESLLLIPKMRDNLRYLAIESHEWYQDGAIEPSSVVSALAQFPNLKTMTVAAEKMNQLPCEGIHVKHLYNYVVIVDPRDKGRHVEDLVKVIKNRWEKCVKGLPMGEVKFKFRVKRGLRGAGRRISEA